MGGPPPDSKRPRPIHPLMANTPNHVIQAASLSFKSIAPEISGPEAPACLSRLNGVAGKLHSLEISIKFLDKRRNLCFIVFQLNQLKRKK